MAEEDTLTLRQLAPDRVSWLKDGGDHYRELAEWLRELAGRCRLPNPQRELLDADMSAEPITYSGGLAG